eukprot:7083204-Pyramimonas_sp.AAC.1
MEPAGHRARGAQRLAGLGSGPPEAQGFAESRLGSDEAPVALGLARRTACVPSAAAPPGTA